ncbi:MAG: hypothetical protein ABL949_01030 [Fimbriimonadaceae bacterium]
MLLGFVAIVVVGFMVTRLIPQSGPVQSQIAPTSAAAPEAPLDNLPTAVISNAFWHPKLVQRVPKPTPKTAPAKSTAPRGEMNKSGGFEPLTGVDPSGNAGEDRQFEVKPKIRLIAVIQSGTASQALIEVNGQQVRVRVGAKMADVHVTEISPTSIALAWGKNSARVRVGQEVELK